MTNVEKTIVNAIKSQKGHRNYDKVLNDVAKAFADCGFFEEVDWKDTLLCAFNKNGAANKMPLPGIMTRQKTMASSNNTDGKPAKMVRRATTVGKITNYEKPLPNYDAMKKEPAKERAKKMEKKNLPAARGTTRHLQPRLLRSTSKEF